MVTLLRRGIFYHTIAERDRTTHTTCHRGTYTSVTPIPMLCCTPTMLKSMSLWHGKGCRIQEPPPCNMGSRTLSPRATRNHSSVRIVWLGLSNRYHCTFSASIYLRASLPSGLPVHHYTSKFKSICRSTRMLQPTVRCTVVHS